MPERETIGVERSGRVAVVTLDHPPVNTLSVSMTAQFAAVLRDLETESDVRAVVITGAGERAFCAGGDIEEFAAMDGPALLQAVRAGQRFLWSLEHLTKPTIAAVNGPCLGAGNGVAMACDLRIAAKGAVFGHPEVTLGLTMAYAGSVRLSRLVGIARAKEMLFTARRISADEAREIGLVHAVVEGAELQPRAISIASEIAKHSPIAVQAAKKALMEGLEKHYPNSLVAEARYLGQVLEADEVWEGFRAYLEKRPPRWHP